MKKQYSLYSYGALFFAIIPGFLILLGNLGVPPNSSKLLFSGIIETLGIAILLLLQLNKDWINNQGTRKITRMALVSVLIFLLALISYVCLYAYLVVDVPHSSPVFFPLWAKGELKLALQQFSRAELITEWGRDDVYKLIQSSSKLPLIITTIILLLVYLCVFISLTFTFGVLGIKRTIVVDHQNGRNYSEPKEVLMNIQEDETEMKDAFICHASEDKQYFVEPFIRELDKNGITYWYDNAQIKWGDSIVKKVNEGLAKSRFVIVVLSNRSMEKRWPNHELESALNIELSDDIVKVLPLVLGNDNDVKQVLKKYPILYSKLYLKYNEGNFDEIIRELKERILVP